jgi:hypothetical protein
VMKPTPLAATPLNIPAGTDPRETLAEWLLTPENPFLARAMVNRVWGQFLGRGIVHPVDDFRATNPPVNPELLDALAVDFARHGFDLRQLMRRIMNSRLYQLSSLPNKTNVQDTSGVESGFNNLRRDARSVELWTTRMDSALLESFGLPNSSENCPVERDDSPSMVQALHLMNSDKLQAKLAHKSGRAAKLGQEGKASEEIVNELYLALYSRWPSDEEKRVALEAFKGEGTKRHEAVEDIIWALINTAEFVFNH